MEWTRSAPLFVYGTLLPGQPLWDLLRPLTASVQPRRAEAPGRLYRTPYGWPAAVFDPSSATVVPGLAVALRNLAHAFPILDTIEGAEAGLFERRLIQTSVGSCWAYHWPGHTDTFEPIRSWAELS
jgi:gamma-glutamylcyclotransferase (GGCT)/AIG2-like uncharacterized protein YtfP